MKDKLIDIAKAAAELNEQSGVTSEEMYESLLKGIKRIPNDLQMFVDSIVSMQRDFPMPKEGWEAFVKDLEYTNQKHGFNLVIKPELLEGQDEPSAYEIYAQSVNKAVEELTDEDKRKAILDSILAAK